MDFQLRYLARLRDELQCSEERYSSLQPCNTLEELISELATRGELWREALTDPSVSVAVNKVLVERNSPLNSGDEVAFLPPVTGG